MKKPYRRFERRNIENHAPQKSNAQSIILAGLNVMQVLEDHVTSYLQTVLHYGPASFTGTHYACVLVWHRPKGYQQYRELTLSGIWAVEKDSLTEIIIGSKILLFSATIYNAESYHAIIKQTFKPYYGDDTSPPSEKQIVYRTSFDVSRRLALRRELAEAIVQWLKTLKT